MRVFGIGIAATALLLATGFPAQRTAEQPARLDQNYVQVLATADQFMCAWQRRDHKAGVALTSPRLQASAKEHLTQFITGLSNPRHVAFEIGPGRNVNPGQIAFEVRLYELYTSEAWQGKRPKPISIVVKRQDSQFWLIDEIP